MTAFIVFVLVMAAFQSFGKLALPPRKWEFLPAAVLFPLPFLFESRIAQTSMQTLNRDLSDAATLENWCALVVIQELFTLTAGFSLLEDIGRDDLRKSGIRYRLRSWKYLVFLPSVLLPAGVLYLQMYLFNALPGMKFRTLTWLLAAGIALTAVLVPEGIRLLRRDRDARILTVLHAEYFLLLPAVFLPVAATARLMPGDDCFPLDSLLLLAGLSGAVLLSGTGFIICQKYKRNQRKKKKCPLQLKS